MGNSVSLVKLALGDFWSSLTTYKDLDERVRVSPGLPVDDPTLPFWTIPPSPIARQFSDLPSYADFVVVGSGITGTSVARALLDGYAAKGVRLTVVMLEARETCSGATGRNGGHISPPLYHDYSTLVEYYGQDAAQKMIRFRLAHLYELRDVAVQEDILKESQWREVETVDVFYNSSLYESAKTRLRAFEMGMPTEAAYHRAIESRDAIETFRLAPDVVGCISSYAGAIHPYRFVTGVLENLLSRYADRKPTQGTPLYGIETPWGSVTTPHVIHATNGWCSHLVEPMRAKIVPIRGNMSAQRPGQNVASSTLSGFRSFIFYTGTIGYDYLTQLPSGENELMLGGGFAREGEVGMQEALTTNDSVYNKTTATHISGALPRYFGESHWGAEKEPEEDKDGVNWYKGRVKALWSGVLGISADMLPWVGSLPPKVSGRQRPPMSSAPQLGKGTESGRLTAAPGEWIAAGYSGEGMVHAWMSGKALASMVMGNEAEVGLSEWFPDILRVTEKRWREAKPETLLEKFKN